MASSYANWLNCISSTTAIPTGLSAAHKSCPQKNYSAPTMMSSVMGLTGISMITASSLANRASFRNTSGIGDPRDKQC